MGKKTAEKQPVRRVRSRRGTIAFVLVLIIFYIGAHVISRTDGVRTLIADKISNGTRLPVSLEQCGATPLLGLRLQGLVLQDIQMPEVKLSFNWFAFLFKEKPFVKRMELKDAEISFHWNPVEQNWEPLVMRAVGRRVGKVMGVNPAQESLGESLPDFPAYAINKHTLLTLQHVQVMWLDGQGKELASVIGADFNVKVGRFIDRKVRQIIVECDQVKLASGQQLDDFRLEAFSVEGSEWSTVLEMSDRQGRYPEFSSKTLWQDLNTHLSSLSAVE